MYMDFDTCVNLILQRCGEHASLIIDHSMGSPMSAGARAFPENAAIQSAMMRSQLCYEPMLLALQTDAARCGCSPLGRLSVQSCSFSGSTAEGCTEGYWKSDGSHRMSDIDAMLELGPVNWVPNAAHETGNSPSVPSLTLEATDNPGFVRVLQVPRPDCRHAQPLPFSAGRVRRFMHDFIRVILPEANSVTITGPAVTAVASREQIDYVACLRIPWQQSRESFAKTTPLDWLSVAAREDIWRYGVHLVPTGCKGSVTEETEWRLSFSRAELVAALHLPRDQIYASVILKRAKRQLGVRGQALKSYFIKTALYWVCQRTPRCKWGGATQFARHILDYLQAAVAARRLPSFFCEDINLLRQATPADLGAMQQTLGALQTNFVPLVVRDMLQNGTAHDLTKIIQHCLPWRLSQRQVLICVIRNMIVLCVRCCYETEYHLKQDRLRVLRTMLRIATAREMQQISSSLLRPLGTSTQRLLRIMAVAPDDVAGRARLTSCPGGGFTWDVAPLMELLTTDDVRKMIVDAPAVFAWWSRQLTRLPSERPVGLSAELNTPRGLAQLVTNPWLLVMALNESVPGWNYYWHAHVSMSIQHIDSFQHCKDNEWKLTRTGMTAVLQDRLHLSQSTAERIAIRWGWYSPWFWSDPDTETRFNTYSRDPWQVWQFIRNALR